MNRASRPVTDLDILKQETKELEDFIDIHLMPIKEALYYIGMETIDYEQLFYVIRGVEQDADEYASQHYSRSLREYYDLHPDVEQRALLMKHFIYLFRQLSLSSMSSERYLEIWEMNLFWMEIDIIGVADFRKDRIVHVYNMLRKLWDIQDQYYRYREPSQPEYQFARFDDRLDEIRARNAKILQAYSERDLGYYSADFLLKQTLEMKNELQDYVRSAMIRTTISPVFVNSLVGDSIRLDIDFYDTIETFKQRIVEIWDLPPTIRFHLIFKGELLSDEKTIGDYPITKYSVVHIVFNPQ